MQDTESLPLDDRIRCAIQSLSMRYARCQSPELLPRMAMQSAKEWGTSNDESKMIYRILMEQVRGTVG